MLHLFLSKFMKQLLLIFLLISSTFCSQAQLLNNKLGEAFTDKPFFSSELVAQNNIQKISGKFTMKKLGDILRKTELKREYYFDEKGRLIKSFETIHAKNGFDTLIAIFEYDDLDRLIATRSKDQYGFYAKHYEYDSLNRPIREEYRRNLNAGANSLDFVLGEEFIVSYETASYESYEGQEKKIVYNSYGVPYREEITYSNEEGQITERIDRLKRTSGIKQTVYKYNEKGLLDSLEISSNQSGKSHRLYTFEYDDFNNLMAKQYFKNGEHQTEYQIIYDGKTMLINYILTREVATNYITILKLDEYSFYGENKKPKHFVDWLFECQLLWEMTIIILIQKIKLLQR